MSFFCTKISPSKEISRFKKSLLKSILFISYLILTILFLSNIGFGFLVISIFGIPSNRLKSEENKFLSGVFKSTSESTNSRLDILFLGLELLEIELSIIFEYSSDVKSVAVSSGTEIILSLFPQNIPFSFNVELMSP